MDLINKWTTLIAFMVLLSLTTSGGYVEGVNDGEPQIYRCYQHSAEQPMSKRRSCYGKYCGKAVHEQSKAVRRFCSNYTEPGSPKPNGNCELVDESGLAGQSELQCYCVGRYCNAAPGSFNKGWVTITASVLALAATMLAHQHV